MLIKVSGRGYDVLLKNKEFYRGGVIVQI